MKSARQRPLARAVMPTTSRNCSTESASRRPAARFWTNGRWIRIVSLAKLRISQVDRLQQWRGRGGTAGVSVSAARNLLLQACEPLRLPPWRSPSPLAITAKIRAFMRGRYFVGRPRFSQYSA